MTECHFCRGLFDRIIVAEVYDICTEGWKRRHYCGLCFERAQIFFFPDEIRRIETINELLDWRQVGF
jgi:hypothetical protein